MVTDDRILARLPYVLGIAARFARIYGNRIDWREEASLCLVEFAKGCDVPQESRFEDLAIVVVKRRLIDVRRREFHSNRRYYTHQEISINFRAVERAGRDWEYGLVDWQGPRLLALIDDREEIAKYLAPLKPRAVELLWAVAMGASYREAMPKLSKSRVSHLYREALRTVREHLTGVAP